MKQKMFILILILVTVAMFGEDLTATKEQYIDLTAKVGTGYISLEWDLIGLDNIFKTELHIKGRSDTEMEILTVTGRNSYILDRDFKLNEKTEFMPVDCWLVTSIGNNAQNLKYIASVILTVTPEEFPQPQNVIYNNGYLSCDMFIDDPELIKRFAGIRVNNRKYKKEFNSYGKYQIKIGKTIIPQNVVALYVSKDKPFIVQESKNVKPEKTAQSIDVLSAATTKDKFSYIQSTVATSDTMDILGLKIEDKQQTGSIKISWNKIDKAEYYYIYRYPPNDSLYTIFTANSLPAWNSARFDRLLFQNGYHDYSALNTEIMKSGFVYTYWISAKSSEKELAVSPKLSVYYFNGTQGIMVKEVKSLELKMDFEQDYQTLISNSEDENVRQVLEQMSFKNIVENFEYADNHVTFNYSYFEINPYKFLLSGNDGYLRIREVVSKFLPAKYANNIRLLALMELINFDPAAEEPVIDRSRIMIDDPIKIPIPQQMIQVEQ